jgi:GNAT superfamily N-acetyltransferase
VQQYSDPVSVRRARATDGAGIARVHVDSWRTTYRGIVPDDYLAHRSYERQGQLWTQSLQSDAPDHGIFVAEDSGGEIVGFADGGPERSGDPVYRGELYAIYLLAASQRRGIGRRLFGAVAEHLAGQGIDRMLVWVLALNPFRHFYEVLGGRLLRSQTIEVGDVALEEVAYGWDDVAALTARRGSASRGGAG